MLWPADFDAEEPLSIRMGCSRREHVVDGLANVLFEKKILWLAGAVSLRLEVADVHLTGGFVVPIPAGGMSERRVVEAAVCRTYIDAAQIVTEPKETHLEESREIRS